MIDTSAIVSALAPGVALTSAAIYWANLQSRLDGLAGRVRSLNTELRHETAGSPRAASIMRQVSMLASRSRVLHAGVVLSVVALVGFLGSSAMLFIAAGTSGAAVVLATVLFMLGLGAFGGSLLTTLWEMLWARRSLAEDIRGSVPRAAASKTATGTVDGDGDGDGDGDADADADVDARLRRTRVL